MNKFIYTQEQASINYDTKITLCKNGYCKIRRYKKELSKLNPGFEYKQDNSYKFNNDIILKKQKNKNIDNVIDKRNIARARDNLIELSSQYESSLYSFITLTFNNYNKNFDINEISQTNKIFHNWVRQTQRKKKDFIYICVPEYQKRGAVHYHLLSNLKPDIDIPKRPIKKLYNKDKKKWIELEYYDIPYWNYGFSSAFDINTTDDNFNIALYITKYLYKDIDNRLFGHQKIMRSKSLKLPNKIYLKDNDIYNKALDYLIKNNYFYNEYSLYYDSENKYIIPFNQLEFRIDPKQFDNFKNVVDLDTNICGSLLAANSQANKQTIKTKQPNKVGKSTFLIEE